MMRQVSRPVRRGARRKGQQWTSLVAYPAINVVTTGKPKMLTGLSQKGTGAGTGSQTYPVMDSQRFRRTESTSPIDVNLVERGKPVLPLLVKVGRP
jgi:hypothetical protein